MSTVGLAKSAWKGARKTPNCVGTMALPSGDRLRPKDCRRRFGVVATEARETCGVNINFDFHGKSVLVTGAAQGIGYEIVKLFSQAGASVIAIDRSESTLARAWEGVARVTCAAADVADGAGIQAVVDAAIERVGRIDVAVNNAGITRDAVVWRLTPEAWQAVLDVHLNGT